MKTGEKFKVSQCHAKDSNTLRCHLFFPWYKINWLQCFFLSSFSSFYLIFILFTICKTWVDGKWIRKWYYVTLIFFSVYGGCVVLRNSSNSVLFRYQTNEIVEQHMTSLVYSFNWNKQLNSVINSYKHDISESFSTLMSHFTVSSDRVVEVAPLRKPNARKCIPS